MKKIVLILLLFLTLSPVYAQAPVGLTAKIYLKDKGWSKETEITNDSVLGSEDSDLLSLCITSEDPKVYDLKVQAYTKEKGWREAVSGSECTDPKTTTAIEALKITSKGDQAQDYKLYFRVNLSNYGWTAWAKGGKTAGTIGLNSSIRALEIKIFKDGDEIDLPEDDVSWARKTSGNSKYNELLTEVKEYPHNTESFTEGLFFNNGELYESSGLYGESQVFKNIDKETGKAEKEADLDINFFGEGSSVFNDKLYNLTYKENKVLVFDPDSLKLLDERDYNDREGWGLTTDGEYLITSDGSSWIYFMDEDLNDIKRIMVKEDGVPVNNINELEYIDGKLWANVWQTNDVLIIDENTGEVLKRINFDGLYKGTGDVFNGIAYDQDTEKIYFTGKNWDTMYEFGIDKNKIF